MIDNNCLSLIVEQPRLRLESFNAAYGPEREKPTECEHKDYKQRQHKPSPLGDYASDNLLERQDALHLRPFCLCKLLFHDLF